MAVRDRFEDAARFVRSATPLIIDGGANRGDTVQESLARFPRGNVIAFEPLPHMLERLRERFDGDQRVSIVPKALGPEAKRVTLNVTGSGAASSLLSPSDIGGQIHGEKLRVAQTVEVKQVRLDQELVGRDIDLLKLDLQGYELHALEGAQGLLPRTTAILTEIGFVRLYDEAVLFGDLDRWLRDRGFDLVNLYDLYTQPDGQLTAGDALYVNRNLKQTA
jgi:FkbM family methyltransferase